MNQRTLFSTPEAARDAAIDRVEDAAPVEWFEHALAAVATTARLHERFTTDDCKEVMEQLAVCDPPEPRAWGAVMRQAAKRGYCRATNETRKSRSAVCHARPMTVWESLLKEQL